MLNLLFNDVNKVKVPQNLLLPLSLHIAFVELKMYAAIAMDDIYTIDVFLGLLIL